MIMYQSKCGLQKKLSQLEQVHHSRNFTTKKEIILPKHPAIADQLSLHLLRTLDNGVSRAMQNIIPTCS